MNIIKYILCIITVLAVTATIMFIPYFYYSTKDEQNSKLYNIDKFSMDTETNIITVDEVIQLISSEHSIFLNNSNHNNKNHIQSMISEFNNMLNYFQSTEYEKGMFSTIKKDDNLLNSKNFFCEEQIIIGIVNNKPISISMFIANISNDFLNINFMFEPITNKIYMFSVIDLYNGSLFSYSEEVEYNEFDLMYDEFYKNACSDIQNYLNIQQPSFQLEISNNIFSFNFDRKYDAEIAIKN